MEKSAGGSILHQSSMSRAVRMPTPLRDVGIAHCLDFLQLCTFNSSTLKLFTLFEPFKLFHSIRDRHEIPRRISRCRSLPGIDRKDPPCEFPVLDDHGSLRWTDSRSVALRD